MPDKSHATRPVALVAGGSRGLGFLIAAQLAKRGYDVAICSRNQDDLEAAATRLEQLTPSAQVFGRTCDVSQPEQVQTLVAWVEDHMGPIEVAIHVAGIIEVGPWSAINRDHFERTISIMLWGPINLALAVVPRMTSRGFGRFGLVSSIGGKVSTPRLLPYNTAKFGAVGFGEGLAAELAGTGVSATTIVPGLMRTGSHLNARFFGDAHAQYSWLAPSACLPLISMNAERAAAQMVTAVLKGKPLAVVSWTSRLAMLIHAIAPQLTIRILGLASRWLPKGSNPEPIPGKEARKKSNYLVKRLTS